MKQQFHKGQTYDFLKNCDFLRTMKLTQISVMKLHTNISHWH